MDASSVKYENGAHDIICKSIQMNDRNLDGMIYCCEHHFHILQMVDTRNTYCCWAHLRNTNTDTRRRQRRYWAIQSFPQLAKLYWKSFHLFHISVTNTVRKGFTGDLYRTKWNMNMWKGMLFLQRCSSQQILNLVKSSNSLNTQNHCWNCVFI